MLSVQFGGYFFMCAGILTAPPTHTPTLGNSRQVQFLHSIASLKFIDFHDRRVYTQRAIPQTSCLRSSFEESLFLDSMTVREFPVDVKALAPELMHSLVPPALKLLVSCRSLSLISPAISPHHATTTHPFFGFQIKPGIKIFITFPVMRSPFSL